MNFRENGLWLMSEWDFNPLEWGCIGFPFAKSQNKLINQGAGTIVAIWITKKTKVEIAKAKKGQVAGFVELSGEAGNMQNLVSDDIFRQHRAVIENAKRWRYAVKIRRAWMVSDASLDLVDNVFRGTYTLRQARNIGTNAKEVVSEANFTNVDLLDVREVNVFEPVR